jgi:nicotinate-nucleotide pyrophosphorylase (carboxylating)
MDLKDLNQLIIRALAEDDAAEDVTTNALIPAEHISEAVILVKEDAVLCGLDIAKKVFQKLDSRIQFRTSYREGAAVKRGSKVATIKGKTRTLLTGERTALNFLGYLSGIATYTHKFVRKTRHTKAVIFDTRKTTPGLRWLEKYAVRCAGAHNHRSSLKELILIKDNHREACRPGLSIAQAIRQARAGTKKLIEVEVDTLAQLREALTADPDIILLDNMSCAQMKKAVDIVQRTASKQKPVLEASGRITLRRVGAVARIGVDRISVGSLTHSHQSVDMSMEIIR